MWCHVLMKHLWRKGKYVICGRSFVQSWNENMRFCKGDLCAKGHDKYYITGDLHYRPHLGSAVEVPLDHHYQQYCTCARLLRQRRPGRERNKTVHMPMAAQPQNLVTDIDPDTEYCVPIHSVHSLVYLAWKDE